MNEFFQQAFGGSSLPFPLFTHEYPEGAGKHSVHSPVPGAHPLLWSVIVEEDFCWDAFDIAEHPLALYDVSATGDPVAASGLVTDGDHGVFRIKLASTAEQEVFGFTMGDQLLVPSRAPFLFLARLKWGAVPGAVESGVWGLASDANVVFDSVATNLWFRVDGDADILVEFDDGTTDIDDQDTGQDLAADVYRWYAIARGFDGFIHYGIADGDGQHMMRYKKLNGSGLLGNLQPVILLAKASGSSSPNIDVDYLLVMSKRA